MAEQGVLGLMSDREMGVEDFCHCVAVIAAGYVVSRSSASLGSVFHGNSGCLPSDCFAFGIIPRTGSGYRCCIGCLFHVSDCARVRRKRAKSASCRAVCNHVCDGCRTDCDALAGNGQLVCFGCRRTGNDPVSDRQDSASEVVIRIIKSAGTMKVPALF